MPLKLAKNGSIGGKLQLKIICNFFYWTIFKYYTIDASMLPLISYAEFFSLDNMQSLLAFNKISEETFKKRFSVDIKFFLVTYCNSEKQIFSLVG